MAVLWLIADYLCVILPFEASAIVLCIEVFNEADRSAIVIYSILSLAMIIVAYAFHPRVHCHGYRRAYINIDHAINHYLNSDKDTKNKQLCDALHQSELYINTSFEIGEACPFKKMMICKKKKYRKCRLRKENCGKCEDKKGTGAPVHADAQKT